MDDTVISEALVKRSAGDLDGLMSKYDIGFVDGVADSYAQNVMRQMGRTVMKNDVKIIASAQYHGLSLASSDRKVVTGAIKAGVDVRGFRFTDDAALWYEHLFSTLSTQTKNPDRFIGPLNPW